MKTDRDGHSHRAGIGLAMLLTCCLLASAASAHDIPDQIRLQGFVKPEGQTLHFLVRVPLIMLLNLDLPKRGPGFLALEHLDDGLQRAAAAVDREILLYADGEQLATRGMRTRISQPSNRAFASFEEARNHINGPALPPDTDVFWNQGYFDAHFQYPIDSPTAEVALELRVAPGLRNILTMHVRFLPVDGPERAFEIHYGPEPVYLDPNRGQVAWTFGRLGFEHILDGIDHLLFLLCLIAPFRVRHFWSLVAVITSFTIAHSITLTAAALGWIPSGAWFPPLVELLIAVSILYMAIENVIQADLRRRWIITGLFGLIHGFGFSFVLQHDLQFAGEHLLLSLMSFNIGVEVGQLLFLLGILPILALVLRTDRAQRYGLIIISVLVGHTAWHWAEERFEELLRVAPPEIEPGFEPTVAGVLVTLGVCSLVIWLARRWRARLRVGDKTLGGQSRLDSEAGP